MAKNTSARASTQRTRRLTVLASATLVAAPLLGIASPAMADGNQKPQVDENVYDSEEKILAKMQGWAPVADSETVMGYPQLEKDLTLADVQKTYDPNTAVQDAVAAAQKYADNAKNTEPLRESARKLVNGWPDAGTPQGNDIRQNTKDTDVGGQSAEQYCQMTNKNPATSSFGQAAPCVFVGKIADAQADKWPVRKEAGAVSAVDEFIKKISASVTDEKSVTDGWTVGGKITPKLGDGKSEVGGEVSFAYNYASTFTRKVQSTEEEDIKILPQGTKQVSVESRANGAYYTGYIVVRGPIEKGQRLIAIPAKAFVQSPETGQPVSWFKRVKP
ncbi:hypothetical protein [Streptomyces sioyaensis]|uniref:hypothetical protein n=1 Tax=Streptomyces sioyaensis TaxID=67364 RepID=UPI00378D86E1